MLTAKIAEADRVSGLEWENGSWSSLTVGPGIYLLLFGSIAAVSGAIWTARMERRSRSICATCWTACI